MLEKLGIHMQNMELDSYLTTFPKINPNGLKSKPETLNYNANIGLSLIF
jgi:hypothetical protein